MSVWIECVEKDYYQCNSCGTTDTLTKVRYGQIEESTSSFRMCDKCLSLIPNREIEALKKQNEIMKEALRFYADGHGECETDSELMPPDDRFPFEGEQMGKRARQALEKLKEIRKKK